MKCHDCGEEMELRNTGKDYNPPGDWQYYDYWMCLKCFHSEDAE